jgi:GNAT superfamily N-acetyltransferase
VIVTGPSRGEGGTGAGATAFLRPITREDIPACVEVFDLAEGALYERLNQELPPSDPSSLQRLLEHLLEHDPGLAWLAEPPSSTADPVRPPVLGFGAAFQRENAWHLSLLYVRPDAQREGLGRRIFCACLPKGPRLPYAGPGGGTLDDPGGSRTDERQTVARGTLTVCTDAVQPVSTGLYATYGLVPRVPIFTALGHPAPGSFPELPGGVVATGFEALDAGLDVSAALDRVDRATLGHVRPVDHALWQGEGHRGVLFHRAGDREALGYGYTSPAGRLGPLALVDPVITPSALGVLFKREAPPGAWVALVPGPFDRALVALLRAGLRFEGFPGMFASTRPVMALDRYLPFSFALP